MKLFKCQKYTFPMRNTQYNIELSVHKQSSVFNITYTIQCRGNCPMKTYTSTFFSFTQFDSTKPIQLLKNNVSDFYMKIINNKHTLLYNVPTKYSIQRYNDLYELTKYLTHIAVLFLFIFF